MRLQDCYLPLAQVAPWPKLPAQARRQLRIAQSLEQRPEHRQPRLRNVREFRETSLRPLPAVRPRLRPADQIRQSRGRQPVPTSRIRRRVSTIRARTQRLQKRRAPRARAPLLGCGAQRGADSRRSMFPDATCQRGRGVARGVLEKQARLAAM